MDELKKLKQENENLRQQIEEISKKRGEQQKKGMIEKASKGKHVSRTPFGYVFEKGELIPATNHKEIEEIFEEFLQKDMNLTKLSKKRNFSVNGLKKVLSNFAYIGKIKFDGQIHEGKHKPLISSTLFNQVQNKLDKMKKT